MEITVVPTLEFVKELKSIAKKHKSILADISKLSDALKQNPTMGISLGKNVYKIRLAISGTNKGKSGGARVITYVIIQDQKVLLSDIYLKSEQDSTDPDGVIQSLKDDGLI
jgi:mRNA-degrading endonuclease RelE of RelBE toxin-antitoxin system